MKMYRISKPDFVDRKAIDEVVTIVAAHIRTVIETAVGIVFHKQIHNIVCFRFMLTYSLETINIVYTRYITGKYIPGISSENMNNILFKISR